MRSRRARVIAAGAVLIVGASACTPPGLPPAQSPTLAASGATVAGGSTTLVIGLDGVPAGFNPHTVADASTSTTAVASLVLPSTFVRGASGRPELNTELLDSAEASGTEASGTEASGTEASGSAPFTVTYRLNRAASWSDGTPITAEDFSYLRNQMLIQVGTVDSAGYRMIDAINSRDAGKTVVVTFTAPYPDWRDLFDNLLPAHILKDSPGGWAAGLDAGPPVSGSRYKLVGFDGTAGEISLVRNDKYWGPQPGPAAVVLRIGSGESLLESFRRGNVQALFLRPDMAQQAELDQLVPAGRRAEVPLAQTVQLLFDTAAPPLSDVRVRHAVVAALNIEQLRTASTGRAAGARGVSSLTALPATATGSDPLSDRPGLARSALEQAGFTRVGLYYGKDGRPLRLTLRYPAGDARLAATARLLQQQLGEVGIEVDLVHIDVAGLVASRFAPSPGAGMTLLEVPRGASDVVAAASAFQCGTLAAPDGSGQGSTPSASAVVSAPAVGTAPVADIDKGAGNLSGFCATDLQDELAAGLRTGVLPAGFDERLWAEVPLLPLAQPVAEFAVSPALAPVLASASASWTFTGPLVGLPTWPNT